MNNVWVFPKGTQGTAFRRPLEELLGGFNGGFFSIKIKMVLHEDIPKWEAFGRLMISPKELYFRNKLVIADKKGKGIGGFITRKLSPHMVSIFTSILKDEDPKDLHNELTRVLGLS